jgi:hypothetical protein
VEPLDSPTYRTSRLIPMARFGLSVAVLAGVAVVPISYGSAQGTDHVLTTTALGAAINDTGAAAGAANTSCCGED